MKMRLIIFLTLFVHLSVFSQKKIESFDVYGRYNPALKDSSKVMLSHTTDEDTFMHIGTLHQVKPRMLRIHSNINCQKYPEVFSTIKKLDTLSFTAFPYYNLEEKNYKHKIYTFSDTENYNDFIVFYHPRKNIEQLSTLHNVHSTPDFYLFTQQYNNSHEEFESDQFKDKYTLDQKRQVYIDQLNYVDGEENKIDYDYNNQNLLFIYKKIKSFTILKKEIEIDNEVVFKSHCINSSY